MGMLQDTLKDKALIYQLIAGISAVTFILLGCFVILKPFFPAMLLATIFTLATWPAFEWLREKSGQKTVLAATMMTLLLAACFIAPLVLIGTSIADNYGKIYDGILNFLQGDLESTAASLSSVKYIGPYLEKAWMMFMTDKAQMTETLKEYAKPTSAVLVNLGKTIGSGLLDITLGVLVSYFFFRHGMHVAVRIRALTDKFGGEQGAKLLRISKNTLIGVVYGILGTALLQGVVAAIGFMIAGVPGATFLGLMTFFLSFVGSSPLIWGPAAIWLYTEGSVGWAIFMAVWGGLFVGSIDNVMKPYFISRGSDLPLLLVLLGIMGGILAFGFIGIFIGPTLLALAYTLLLEWSSTRARIEAEAEEVPAAKPKRVKKKS